MLADSPVSVVQMRQAEGVFPQPLSWGQFHRFPTLANVSHLEELERAVEREEEEERGKEERGEKEEGGEKRGGDKEGGGEEGGSLNTETH